MPARAWDREWIGLPNLDHVRVHPSQLLFRRVECIWGRVEFVGFETLVREPDLERLIIFLYMHFK